MFFQVFTEYYIGKELYLESAIQISEKVSKIYASKIFEEFIDHIIYVGF
jgi:hypothetical protein